MVRHWRAERSPGWEGRAIINGVGAVFTTAALAIELFSKFTEGAWLIVIVVPLLVLMFLRVRKAYDRIGAQLELGKKPAPPHRLSSLAVVPVRGMSRLTAEAVSAALSIGDEVVAVTVCFADPADTEVDAAFRDDWEAWHPNVPLISLRTSHRSLGPPIVDYLRALEEAERYQRLVVLIPEVAPDRPWQRILQNQRGFVLERAIQRGTQGVVICRLRFRLTSMTGQDRGSP